jgi:hypothetical protein
VLADAITALRGLRLNGPEIAEVLGMARSTVPGTPGRTFRRLLSDPPVLDRSLELI